MPVGAGIAVGTVGAGILSSRASAQASDVAAEGAERSGAQIQAAADRARTDVLDFFPSAQQDLLAGAGAAGGLLAGGIGEQQRLLSAGNVGAQGTLQGGFGQVQNALLGLPVDQQAFAPKSIELSPIPQNPLAQTIQQNPAAQQALTGPPTAQEQANFANLTPQQQQQVSTLTTQQIQGLRGAQQPSALFSDISQVQPEANKKAFEGLKTNQDFISAIERGSLDAKGIDLGFFKALANDHPEWSSGTNLMELINISPAAMSDVLLSGGLNPENQQKIKDLVHELQRLGDVDVPESAPVAQSNNRNQSRRRGRR